MSWDRNDGYGILGAPGGGKPCEGGIAYPDCIGMGVIDREELDNGDACLRRLFDQLGAFEQREARRFTLGGPMQASDGLDPGIARRETRLQACLSVV